MGKYGQAAIEAVNLLNTGTTYNPERAWYIATGSIFGKGTSGQKKGCPKDAFLGLCEEGLIKGVQPGNYTRSTKNKAYALKAVSILKKAPQFSDKPEDLWNLVLQGEVKSHNHQMDVVTSLWNNNMIAI